MLPLKTRIMDYAITRGTAFEDQDVMTALDSEFHGERLFTLKHVDEYLDSFLGVGFLDAEDLKLDEAGKLHVTYKVTDYGRSRGKYLGH